MAHTVHTNGDKRGQEGGEGLRETDRGRWGGQDAMGCALLCLNEEKQLSHTPPLIFKRKRQRKKKTRRNTSKIIETPPVPHIIKNNNTVAVRNGRAGRRAQPERSGTRPRRWSSTDGRRRREVAVRVVWAVGSHCVIVTSVCDWRTSKGLARGEERRSGGVDRDEESRGGGGE